MIFNKQGRLICSAMVVFLLVGCAEPESELASTPNVAATYSHERVCKFAQRLQAFNKVTEIDTSELRYVNEQWRELNLSRSIFPLSEATASREILSKLNLALAHETVTLIDESVLIVGEAYEQIEGLRRFSRDPDNMKVPDSIIRTMVNRLDDCCLNALKGNATTLVREAKNTPMYNVGELAYFINRDVNAILRNELSLEHYRQQLKAAASELPAYQSIAIHTNWAQCQAI